MGGEGYRATRKSRTPPGEYSTGDLRWPDFGETQSEAQRTAMEAALGAEQAAMESQQFERDAKEAELAEIELLKKALAQFTGD